MDNTKYFDEQTAKLVLLAFALSSDIYCKAWENALTKQKTVQYYDLQPKCPRYAAVIKYILNIYGVLLAGYEKTNRYDYAPGCKVVRVYPLVFDFKADIPQVEFFRDMFRARFTMSQQLWQPAVTQISSKTFPKYFGLCLKSKKQDVIANAVEKMGIAKLIPAEKAKYLSK